MRAFHARLAATMVMAVAAFDACAQTTYYEWRQQFVSSAYRKSPIAAAHDYADSYCANQGSPAQYSGCTPDYVNLAASGYPTYVTRLRLTRISDGGTTFTGQSMIISQTDPVQPPAPEDTKQLGCNSGCARNGDPVKGNPINFATGNKAQTETDYVSAGSFPLAFKRYYNSKSPDSGVLGAKWRHNFESSVEMRQATSSSKIARLRRPDGRILTYTLVSGVWQADADVVGALTWTATSLENPITWTFVTGEDAVESYDAKGRLTGITDRAGSSQTLTYDSQGRLSTVTDQFGRQLQIGYDTQNRLSTLTDPASSTYTYTYSTSGMLAQVAYPGTVNRQYFYNESAHTGGANLPTALTGIQDEAGNRFATFQYDTTGRAVSSTHAGGAGQISVVYNVNGTSSLTDSLGTARTYTFTITNGVKKISSSTGTACLSCGDYASYTYDTSGNVSSRTDANGNITSHTNDLTRNLETSRTEAYGTAKARTITTTWHSTYRLPDVITEGNRTSDHDYDSDGNLTQTTITDTATSTSRTWAYTHDSFGRVLTENGPRTDVSDVTTYTYYSAAATCTATVTGASATGCRGQLETIANALSHVTTFNEYNAHGQALKITDPNGTVTTLAYDARQRLTSRDVGGETTAFEYWPTGLLKKVTLPDSSFLSYTYDAAHRLTEIEDDEGNRIEYTLDAMGNRTAEEVYDPSSALVRTRTQVFNSLNQLWKQVGAAGTSAVTTTFAYDANGNQTSIAAPLSRTTAQQYDELDRLKQITDPASGVTQFAYNRFDELTQVTDPRSLATTYTYNNLGDLTQLQSPDTGTTASTYDSAGNLATRTDARSKTGTYAYDALNRVTSITYSDQTLSFTYDAGTHGKGQLTGASDANHSLSFTYDAQGRVTGKNQTVGAVTKSVSYGYTDGNLTSLTTPSGQSITYGYANGRIASITLNGSTPILSDVLHDPFGAISGWEWGNATIAVRTYDEDGKIEAVDSAGATTYGYDDAFRITGITDLDDSSRSWTYGYDTLDRLTSGSKTGQTIGYTYDANGNRLSQTGTQTATYSISGTSNRVSSITGTPARTYAYDAAGNTTGYGGFTFAYSDSGRMKSVTDGSGTTNYTINALGQRVKKAGPGGTRLFVYDEAGHLLGEYDGSGTLVQETVWMGDTPVATLRPNGGGVSVFYVHTDHLNTPRRISRPSDNVIVWRGDSEPFGSAAANEDPDGDSTAFSYNLRFPGQYHDPESGLSYNYFRDYDPVLGRYIQSDPIGLAGGINTYSYVASNPIHLIDPTGEQANDFRIPTPAQIEEQSQRSCARQAFYRNYMIMREWKLSDKYFHCKANCEATRCGPYGYAEACDISGVREIYGHYFKGDPIADAQADLAANQHGRDTARQNPNQTCQVICSKFRPPGLPGRF